MTLPLLRGLSAAVILAAAAGPLAAQYPTEPPPPMPMGEVRFPPFREAALANGLDVIVVENRELPVVSLSLAMPVGQVHDPDAMSGLAAMVAELLSKGTASRSAEEIAATIEGVGGSLTASAGDDFFSISTTVLTEHVDLAMELMADVLLQATFPEEELELARRRTLSALRLEKSDPSAIAQRFFRATLYGEHAYARTPTEASVQAITREAVVGWARTHLLPRGAMLVVAGDLNLDRARGLARRHLGAWSGTPPERYYAAPPAGGATTILLVHRPASEQSNIIIGNLALRPQDALYYGATVMNKFLGGGTDARLFQILREEKGWTYGSYSSLTRPRDVGAFIARAEVRTEVTDSALVELLRQLRRVRGEVPPAEELDAARNYLTGSFPRRIETPQQIASQVSQQRRLGLGDDYIRRYRERIAAVGPEDVQRAARAVVRPDSAVIVIVGDGSAIHGRIAGIAPVRITDVDGNPLTPEDLAPAAVALTFDASQLTARRDSFQVMVQGNPMGTYISEILPEADLVVFTESLAIPMIGMQQASRIELGPDLEIRSLGQTVAMGGQTGEALLTFADGRVSGTAVEPPAGPGQPIGTRDVDTTLTGPMYESNQLQALIPALDLAEGASWTVQAYAPAQNRVRTLTISVEGVEEAIVPAGAFETFRVSVTGGETPMVMHISTAAPRRVVRLELVGTPLVFELAND